MWSSDGMMLTGENQRTLRQVFPVATLSTAYTDIRVDSTAANHLSYACSFFFNNISVTILHLFLVKKNYGTKPITKYLTICNKVCLQKLIVAYSVKEFSAFMKSKIHYRIHNIPRLVRIHVLAFR
jgi:hypothetical protein